MSVVRYIILGGNNSEEGVKVGDMTSNFNYLELRCEDKLTK